MSKTVSIYGQAGSYHDQVFTAQFSAKDKAIYCESFKELFSNVVSGESDYSLVAIENALYGSINEVDALLMDTGCQIIAEYYLRINFCLIGLPEAALDKITDVYSLTIALVQCRIWLEKNLPNAKQHDIGDTSGAVGFVKEQADPTKAALASKHAADFHGLKVLAQDLENDAKNFTRFVLITKDPKPITNATKTSVVLETANKPGSLHEVLSIFKDLDINLTKLDSKPIPGKPWEYMFFIDFEAGINDPKTQRLFTLLDSSGHTAQVLGSYVAASAPRS